MKNYNWIIQDCLVLGALVLSIASSAHADTVRGQIYHANGKSRIDPAVEAQVMLQAMDSGETSYPTYTNEEGRFIFEGIPPGNYLLLVMPQNYNFPPQIVPPLIMPPQPRESQPYNGSSMPQHASSMPQHGSAPQIVPPQPRAFSLYSGRSIPNLKGGTILSFPIQVLPEHHLTDVPPIAIP